MDTISSALAVTSGAPSRLLVVDDDRDVCELVSEVFDSIPGLSVVTCTDPRDALEYIEHRPVDVVLTDLYMGRYSGMDIFDAVSEHNPEAVVILMTGQPSVENAIEVMRKGAYDYLLKPFDMHALRRTVERAFERRKLWLENAHLTEMVALYKLSHASISNAGLDDLYQLALNALRAELDPDFISICTMQTVSIVETVCWHGEPVDGSERAFFCGKDAQSREAIASVAPVVKGLSSPHRCRSNRAMNTLQAYRVSFPVHLQERVVGLINFQCPPKPQPINAGDLKTVAILAAQLASAIENRRLLDCLQTSYMDMVHALAGALDARDPNTRDHTDRVCHLAEAIAREIGWTQDQMPELWLGCVLHDIGKIAVPDTVLQKPGPLTHSEFELMKSHTIRGVQMIESIPNLQPAIPYILYHHEKYDGSGYPHGLKGTDIPLQARLLSVVDAFDAITSDRPYRKGRSYAIALAEIQACSGTHFDPEVVEAFMRAWTRGLITSEDSSSAPAGTISQRVHSNTASV